jgi:hypothetical protein
MGNGVTAPVALLVDALWGGHIQWGLAVVLFIMLGGSAARLYRSRLTHR